MGEGGVIYVGNLVENEQISVPIISIKYAFEMTKLVKNVTKFFDDDLGILSHFFGLEEIFKFPLIF